MGESAGHAFRGNQWTGGIAGGGVGEGRVSQGHDYRQIAESRAGNVGKVLGRIQDQRAELMMHERTKEDWLYSAKMERELAAAAQAKLTEAERRNDEFKKRADEAVKELYDQKRTAEKACGEAWKKWQAVNDGKGYGVNMDDPNLSPEQKAAAAEYRQTQALTILADENWNLARSQWIREHHTEELEIRRDMNAARDELRDHASKMAVAERAAANYDRDAAREAQIASDPRDPRETGATAYNAMKADVAEGNAKFNIRPDGSREYLDVTGKPITPAFEATIKSNSDFRARMEKLFPGMEVEGLPRKADMHMLTIVHDEFRALRDEFPEVAVRAIKLNAGGMRATAWSGEDKITFGKQGIEDFGAAHAGFASGKTRENPEDPTDFHDGQRSYAAVVRHEFAHQVHFQHPELLSRFNNEVAKIHPRERARVTGYANKNHHERFAETFAMVKYGDKGTKAHPQVQLMDRLVKEYFGQYRAKRKSRS